MASNYILGAHNSWSYLPPKHWWMRPFAFMARCQRVDIRKQYALGVRCFDLRIRFDGSGNHMVAHGSMVYGITPKELHDDLLWLDAQGDCHVRLLHEVRRRRQHTALAVHDFRNLCRRWEATFRHIRWWCGRNLFDWEKDYDFGVEPTCHEDYSSVSEPKYVDDWWPWLYARMHNADIYADGTDREILLMDYVDIRD